MRVLDLLVLYLRDLVVQCQARAHVKDLEESHLGCGAWVLTRRAEELVEHLWLPLPLRLAL